MRLLSLYVRFIMVHLILGVPALCVLAFLSHPAFSQRKSCPCPDSCAPCAGGLTNLTLVYTGQQPILVVAWDRTIAITAEIVRQGDTLRLNGTLPNSRFRENSITLVLGGFLQLPVDVTCRGFEVYKPVGPFIMLSATSLAGGAVCCASELDFDSFPPVADATPGDIFSVTQNGCSSVVRWSEPIFTDCGDVALTSSHASGGTFPLGITTVHYTATDLRGNKSYVEFDVTVRDETPPVFTNCPGEIVINTRDSLGSVVVWSEPIALDNCGEMRVEKNIAPGSFLVPGSYQIRYQARDANQNVAVCTFPLRVVYTPSAAEVIVHKLITPDGDGINDWLKIEYIEKYPENHIVVIDRWGSEIFYARNYDNTSVVWDGTSKSRRLPTGTYFFSLTLVTHYGQVEHKGFIELIN